MEHHFHAFFDFLHSKQELFAGFLFAAERRLYILEDLVFGELLFLEAVAHPLHYIHLAVDVVQLSGHKDADLAGQDDVEVLGPVLYS